MAGGSITRIVGGKIISESETYLEDFNNIMHSAGTKVTYNSDTQHYVGDWEEIQAGKHFLKGWWTDKNDKPISDAHILDTVKFHIQTQGIDNPKDKKIEIKLYEYDTSIFLSLGKYDRGTFETRPFDDHVRIKSGENEVTELTLDENGKATITINLVWGLHEMFNETFFGGLAEMGVLEFYFECSYGDEKGVWLPASLTDYLKVTISNKSLFIKPAYEGYNFPEIRTADGDIVVFSKGIGLEHEPSKELENQLGAIADKIKGDLYGDVREVMMKYSDNMRHTIAVRQLKRGYLANNMDKIEFSRKIYTKPVFDNNGELFEITRAANFGYKKDGKLVTTKGISQLDYFKEVGSLNNIAKASKELLGIFDFASDVISFAMDENPATIPTGFAPLDFIVALVMPSISEPIIEKWDNVVFELAEKAKDKGVTGINTFLKSPGGGEDRYRYGILEINQEILNRLLRGEIKTLIELQDLKDNEMIKSNYNRSLFIYTVFHHISHLDNKNEVAVLIDSIFINH